MIASGTPVAPTADDDVHDAFVDAGDLGCGDLVLMLKRSLDGMAAGAVLKLHAQDPGAAADIPAWCRLTRHLLVRADAGAGDYWIRRRPD